MDLALTAGICTALLLSGAIAIVVFFLWEEWRENHPDDMLPIPGWAKALWRRTQPSEPPDDDELIGVLVAPSPLLSRHPPEDLSWLAPTGAYPLITSSAYGTPALLHAPAELRWARWTTPANGVPVLTAAGAVR